MLCMACSLCVCFFSRLRKCKYQTTTNVAGESRTRAEIKYTLSASRSGLRRIVTQSGAVCAIPNIHAFVFFFFCVAYAMKTVKQHSVGQLTSGKSTRSERTESPSSSIGRMARTQRMCQLILIGNHARGPTGLHTPL